MPIIERNVYNTTLVTYTRALGAPGGIGGLISQVRSGVSTWYHYIHTGLTNVSHLTNSTGAVVRRYEFDAFGNVTYQSGSTTNNYRFQTKELHAKSNLVYFGARWYNPVIGRWTTPDPAGIIDGPNLYIYLNNNPINDIDEWGLCGGVSWWGNIFDNFLNTLEDISNALMMNPFADGMLQVPLDQGLGIIGVGAVKLTRYVGKGGTIMLGRFRGYLPKLIKLAERYHARILKNPFPKGVSLKQGLRAEIDAAKKIYFRMRGVKPGTISHDIELKYIKSKQVLWDKTKFLRRE